MVEEKRQGVSPGEATPEMILSRLPEDGVRLAIVLSTGGGTSQGEWFIDDMSQDGEIGFDKEEGMEALFEFGVLEKVTFIQEREEQLAALPRPREVLMMPIEELDSEQINKRFDTRPTDEESKYLRLASDIEKYRKNRDKHPERYKNWEEPRYRLSPEFQDFLDQLRLELEEQNSE